MNDNERRIALITDMLAHSTETDWFEFKHNNNDPKMIGVRISALANAARLIDRDTAYIVWGVEDGSHNVVGTCFDPKNQTTKNQPLEFWLAKMLKPSLQCDFHELRYQEERLILLEISTATISPVEFDRTAYIRINSATPRLSDHPGRLKNLWTKLQPFAWETANAKSFISKDDVLSLLDYPSYFELIKQPLPDNRDGIFERLAEEDLIEKDVGGNWNIKNLGAILFARKLSDFDRSLDRKGIRITQYDGSSRTSDVLNRHDISKGYAVVFEIVIGLINSMLPKNEKIVGALRTKEEIFPPVAIRELIANALIHQDLTLTGTGPNIELFKDRIEITNPGKPLTPTERFIDFPPRSRNETLAALMRRMGICEEQGSGVDKVVNAVEIFQLPPPDFRAEGDMTRVILYGPRDFSQMTPNERIRACYQHSVLKFLSGERMKNSTLRKRLGVADQNSAQISIVIRQATDKNLIKTVDPDKPRAGYVPFWA